MKGVITKRHLEQAALDHLLAARVNAAVQVLTATVQKERPEVEVQR